MDIRPYSDSDWPAVWAIVEEVVRAGDTFTYDPAMTAAEARSMTGGVAAVAETAGRVVGFAYMGANRDGPGAHVATASFMVASDARGRGVGTALVEHALAWAREEGFAGMQFNAVAASNTTAVALYERLGFAIVGTVPRAFEHPEQGRVGLHVMYRDL